MATRQRASACAAAPARRRRRRPAVRVWVPWYAEARPGPVRTTELERAEQAATRIHVVLAVFGFGRTTRARPPRDGAPARTRAPCSRACRERRPSSSGTRRTRRPTGAVPASSSSTRRRRRTTRSRSCSRSGKPVRAGRGTDHGLAPARGPLQRAPDRRRRHARAPGRAGAGGDPARRVPAGGPRHLQLRARRRVAPRRLALRAGTARQASEAGGRGLRRRRPRRNAWRRPLRDLSVE